MKDLLLNILAVLLIIPALVIAIPLALAYLAHKIAIGMVTNIGNA